MRVRSLAAFLPKSNLPKPISHPSFTRFRNQSHGTLAISEICSQSMELVAFCCGKHRPSQPFNRAAWGDTTTKSEGRYFFDRGSKDKLSQVVGACGDQFFRPGFRVCATQSAPCPHPYRAGKFTEPIGAQRRSTLFPLR